MTKTGKNAKNDEEAAILNLTDKEHGSSHKISLSTETNCRKKKYGKLVDSLYCVRIDLDCERNIPDAPRQRHKQEPAKPVTSKECWTMSRF